MPTLEELIADAQGFGDDLELLTADGKVKISAGDVRKLLASNKTAAEKLQQELLTKRKQVEEMANQAAALLSELGEQKKSAAAAAAAAAAKGTEPEEWRNDPMLAPIAKHLDASSKAIEKLTADYNQKLEELGKAVVQMAQVGIHRFWNEDYGRLEHKPKDKTLDDLIKLAVENKVLDRWGLPDPIGMASRLTEQERIELAKTQAFEEGKTKGAEEARAQAYSPRPTGTAAIPRPAAGEKPELADTSFGKQIEAALQDPEILRLTGGVQ